MSLSESERRTIVTRELEKAQRTLDDAIFCANQGKWEAASNRFYYALFHAVSAMLVNDRGQIEHKMTQLYPPTSISLTI